MATRLYPNTEDRIVLAQLAGVPAATWERLDRLTQAEQPLDDEEVSELESFLLIGWGRVDVASVLALGFSPTCDGIDDPETVRRLLEAHQVNLKGVEADRLEGFHWA